MGTNQKRILETVDGRKMVRDEAKKIRDYFDMFVSALQKEATEDHVKEIETMHDVISLDTIMFLKKTWGLEMVDLQ